MIGRYAAARKRTLYRAPKRRARKGQGWGSRGGISVSIGDHSIFCPLLKEGLSRRSTGVGTRLANATTTPFVEQGRNEEASESQGSPWKRVPTQQEDGRKPQQYPFVSGSCLPASN